MSLTSYEDCVTKQTFCALNKETVGDNEDFLNSDLPTIVKDETLVSDELMNNIKDILINIKNYGNEGTRNPTQEQINKVNNHSDNEYILLDDYNIVLDILGKELLSSDNSYIISKQLMDNLQQHIKSYKLDSTRCNYCNASGNCSQCDCDCDCDCSDWCDWCNCNCDCDLCGGCNCSLYCTAWG